MEGNTNSSPSREQTRFACSKIIDSSLRALYQIWDKMGFDESQRKARGDTAITHVKNLMQNMITEEETLMKQVAATIDEFTEKLDQLCSDLSLPHIKMSGLTMVQKEKSLRSKVDTMMKEKKDRMTKYDSLHNRDQHLCEILCTTPYYIATGKVPTLEQLRELEKHVTNLQAERDKRYTEFVTTKKNIIELYDALESEPDTSFGFELICEDDDSNSLSSKNMENLKQLYDELLKKDKDMKIETDQLWERLRALWNRIETSDVDKKEFEKRMKGHGTKVISALKTEIEACELLKFQNMHKFLKGIRSELISWWNKCYYSQEQRNIFKAFSEEQCTEELLSAHEQELENVRQYYNTRKEILDQIARREELFSNMMAFEVKASDPNRFFCDRGGKLLQEEKARKKLMKELPKVEEEVTEAILKWEQDNHMEFLVDGMTFSEYVKNKWENFQLQKELQKQSRLKARAKQTQDEMLYGSKSVSQTPTKRKLPTSATPVKTPLKTRKGEMAPSVSVKVKIHYDGMNDVTKVPSTTSKLPNNYRYQHSTVVHSPAAKKPLFMPKASPLNKPKKKRSIRLMRKSTTKSSLGNNNRRRSRDAFSFTTLTRNVHSSSILAAHGTYPDFAAGLTEPDSHSSVASSSTSCQL